MVEVLEVSEVARVCQRGLIGFGICNIHHTWTNYLNRKCGYVQWNQAKSKVQCQSDTLQLGPTVGIKSKGLSRRKGACLHAGRSYISSELSCTPTTKGSPTGRWGDTQLKVLLELLSR
jgi:hypothetical protein